MKTPSIINDLQASGIDLVLLPEYTGPFRSITDNVEWEFFRNDSVSAISYRTDYIDCAQQALEEVIHRTAVKENVDTLHLIEYKIEGPYHRGYDVYLKWVDQTSQEGQDWLKAEGWID